MKYLLLLFLFPGLLHAQRDPADTVLVKRAQYIGIYAGMLHFANAEKDAYGYSLLATSLEQVVHVQMGNAYHGGLFFTVPFLHRMDWEVGLGVFAAQREITRAQVTSYVYDADSTQLPGSFHSWIRKDYSTVAQFRSFVNYELRRREKSVFLLGAGGWLALGKLYGGIDPGEIGLELKATAYFRLQNKTYIQASVSPGLMHYGFYFNFGIAICYEGQRTMHVHPKHYYVRTYEEGE